MAKKNINPEVRFKGFTKDWKHQELRFVLTERKTMQKISEDAPILAFASGQGVIDRSERRSNNRDHLTLDQENKVYKLTELNDIVYNPSNLKYGAIDRNKHGRGVISPIYVTFTTEEEPSFIELIVKSEKFKLRALQYEEGTVVKRQSVSPENLLSLKVGVSPSLDEQKKLGKLFRNIDNLVSYHQNIYDKIVVLKKAMLEKMFPSNKEDIPRIRFKRFIDKWEENELGNVLNLLKDGTHGTHVNVDIDWVYLLSAKNIKNGKVTVDDSDRKISRTDFNTIHKNFKLQKGDVLLTVVGSIGESAILESPDDITFQRSVAYLRPNKKMSSSFLVTLTKSINFQNELKNRQVISAQPGIYLGQLEVIPIQFPKIEEQKLVGTFFQEIERLINLKKTELDNLKNIKKACFSKLFVPQE